MPILVTLPLVLKMISFKIFTNIEFKTQTYRYLRLNLIIHIISLILIIILPFTFFFEESKFITLRNNYWILVYQLYFIFLIGRSLHSFNSILNFTLAWNQFLDSYCKKITTNLFYAVVIIGFIISFCLHLPNVFLIQINSSKNETNELNFNKYYFLIFISIEYGFDGFLFLFTILLNFIIAFKNKQHKSRKFQSIIYAQTKNSIVLDKKISRACKIVSSQSINNQYNQKFGVNVESKVKSSISLITTVHSIDNFFNSLISVILIYVKLYSKKYLELVLTFFYFTIIFSYFFHFFIYYKSNHAFAYRFVNIFKYLKDDQNSDFNTDDAEDVEDTLSKSINKV
jgi:hypothetical protein